jgi:putative salt-induced outer membrane protein YdiY
MRPSIIHLLLALGLLLGLTTATHADVLKLANGDLLQGKLVGREGGIIRWEHPQLGLLSVPAASATIESSPVPATPEIALVPLPGAAAKPASAQKSAATEKPATPAARPWRTVVESGVSLQSGRSDRTDINLRAESTFKRRRNEVRLQARYVYSQADKAVTSERTEASLRWRRELSNRWFAQTTGSYYASEIKGIDHNVEQNLGVGYRLAKSERTSASVGAGITGQYREVVGADPGDSLFGEIFQDFALKLSPRLELGEELAANYSPSGRGIRILPNGQVQIINTDVTNYTLALKSFLRGKLTETLSLALRYEYDFDNTYVSGSAKGDQRITTTVGYAF